MSELQNVHCRVCGQQSRYLWTGVLIGHDVRYFECDSCGYVQTEHPHWLPEAYSQAINASDTGILMRNQANVAAVMATLFLMRKTAGSVVDSAGGYGLLVRMLRDIGVDAKWSDPYCENLVAKGFEYVQGVSDLVTSFEAFEHFENPAEELDSLLQVSDTLLLSTSIIERPTPKLEDWWYYGLDHGQHIGFFRIESLRRMAEQRGLHLISDGESLHLISRVRYSESYWRILLRYRKVVGRFARRGLVSKTWSDHVEVVSSVGRDA